MQPFLLVRYQSNDDCRRSDFISVCSAQTKKYFLESIIREIVAKVTVKKTNGKSSRQCE